MSLRIAELEAATADAIRDRDKAERQLDHEHDRIAELEGKLARVREHVHNNFLADEEDWDRLDTILSDSRQPLAVVTGVKRIDGETSHRRACVDAWLPGKAEDWPADTYRLIVTEESEV